MIRASTSWRLRRESRNQFLFRGRIWVDGQDFAVVRMEANQPKTPRVDERNASTSPMKR